MCFAWAAVEVSGQAGPDAIISNGPPTTSDNTTEKTLAGAHSAANFPPFTAENRLRRVLISTISAPQDSSSRVSRSKSPAGISGDSNRADPPPESRNRTVSPESSADTASMARRVAEKEFSSGTGCPAS